MTKQINVQGHVFVPKHVLLNEKEVQELLTRYNISPQQMPTISAKDPALDELNARVGDIIKIIRNSQTQGKSFFYRVVRL